MKPFLGAMALWATLCPLAQAQYPSRPVQLVSPVSAGSAADTLARIVGEGLSRTLGKPVLVENRPGAEGLIAAQMVAAAAPDGHTLLFGGSATFALPMLAKPALLDAADLVAASTIGRIVYGLFVHPSQAPSTREFLAYARANPGKLNYGSVNISTELAASQLMRSAGIELVKVPYKGGGQVMTDLVAGRVHVFFGPVANGSSYAKEGRLRLLAVHPNRSTLVPEVPTLADEGVAVAFEPLYYMLLARAKTSPEILERISRALGTTLLDPSVRAQLERQGLVVEASTPERAAVVVREGIATYARLLGESSAAAK